MDERTRLAVAANVAWCDLVCRTHGIPTIDDGAVWSATSRSPTAYPDAITLRSDAPDVLERSEPGPGRSVKDSFSSLDLVPDGLVVLFEARWIFCEAVAPASGGWTARAQSGWPDAVRILDLVRDGRLAARAIANRCDGVIGVSNVVAVAVDAEELWSTLRPAVAAALGPLPLAGYERGTDLPPALAAGFDDVGPLRVWVTPEDQPRVTPPARG